jgi:glucokinase
MTDGILAIDFGGTRTRAAWFDNDIQQQARTETPTLVDQGQQAVIARIIDTARAVIPAGGRIRAIGISAPGPLDARRGVIEHARTLPGWQDVPLAAIVSDALGGVPVYMENDANLAALAEHDRGSAAGSDPLIYLTISTGIGGGAVIGGELFTGWRGLAIEPGHQRFTLPDGSIRRLEELASGTALGQHAALLLAQDTTTPSVLRDVAPVDGKAVGNAARAGDALAVRIVEEAGRWLGLGLVNVMHLFNPQAIVLGGSVAQLGDLLLDPARRVIAEHILAPGFDAPGLVQITSLGDDVCLVGAALYAQRSVQREA